MTAVAVVEIAATIPAVETAVTAAAAAANVEPAEIRQHLRVA
jgi:hypothetical protein